MCGTELDSILKSLEKDASLLSNWFANNYMKMNDNKSHLLVLGNESVETTLNISGSLMKESSNSETTCTSTYIDIYGKVTVRINYYHFHNVTFISVGGLEI